LLFWGEEKCVHSTNIFGEEMEKRYKSGIKGVCGSWDK
jgi:hypothetical protein